MKLTIAAVVAVLALLLADCVGGTTEKVAATITGRIVHPAYTTVSCTGKPVVCTTTYHPQSYDLVVKTATGYRTIDTGSAGYYSTHEGQHITFRQRRGCLSHYAWLATYNPDSE